MSTTMLSAAEIRTTFLKFFEEKAHKIVPSAPIVIKNDPTLLFTNAGMNQFKEFFLGVKDAPYKRVADTQKCLRVSGKHNDLEEVGVDTYHHTMFEMLGNWSFGDYFKKEAIAWSWELLTEVYKIDKDRIFVTVFEGDEKENLPFDQEAFDEWKKWIAADRILKGNKKDNFWEMGDTGPCGPCSEIHVDCRSDEERAAVPGETLVNADHPQVIEIWNNVFMEFNRMKDGSLQKLPAQHVDTGMGFERLVRVLQNKTSNYDTDVFTLTIAAIENIVQQKYTFGDDLQSVAFRVLADHIRAIVFTIADGQLPAATGAGYVIRRILRRAVRYYHTYLGYDQALLYQLVPCIASQFETVFSEVKAQEAFVAKVIKEEEISFLKTLEKGIKRFEEYMNQWNTNHSENPGISAIVGTTTEDIIHELDKQRAKVVAGDFAFELYDTYGFPYDLTDLIARENGWVVDEAGFKAAMQKQKDRSRAATALDTGDWVILKEADSSFVGYQEYNTEAQVLRYRTITAKGKSQYQIILDKTPFYPEGGGQVGDTGVLIFDDEVISVVDTKKENNQIIHFTDQLPKDITASVVAKIDWEKRKAAAANHSATHLLHAALKNILGAHVNQKGSLVSDSVLRFDIAHFSKMTDAELEAVTHMVNEKIRANIPVQIKEMPKEEALQLGAMALFGEKYGDVVRTVIIDPKFSIELCGGTHVAATGEIGTFVITGESALAAGVRRIEALTGAAAVAYLMEKAGVVKQLAEAMKTKDVLKSFQKLQEDKAGLEKQVAALDQQALAVQTQELISFAQQQESYQLLIHEAKVSQMDGLKKMANDAKALLGEALVVLYAVHQDKPMLAVAISDALAKTKNWNAGVLIKSTIAPLIKGGGGGSATLANAGGSDVAGLKNIEAVIKEWIG